MVVDEGRRGAGLAVLACLLLVPGCYTGVDADRDSGFGGPGAEDPDADGSAEGGDTGGGPDGDDPGAVPSCAADGPAPSMRRLSKPELEGSYASLFGDLVEEPGFEEAFALVPNEPTSDPALGFANAQVDFDSLYGVARQLVDRTLEDPARLDAVLGCSDTAQPDCLEALVDRFAPAAYRRPLTSEESGALRDYASEVGGAEGLRFAMVRVLMSPAFTQHLELGDEQDGVGERIRLTPYEVASRLSYQLTGAPPDAQLRAAAEAGELEDEDALRDHAMRLLKTDAARETVRRFALHWLAVEAVPTPDEMLASEYGIDDPAGFADEARDELLAFVEHVVFEQEGTFEDLLLDKTAFPQTPGLASAYGLPQSDAPSAFPADDARGGVLLRAATMVSPVDHSLPIKRGLYVRNRLLCETLPSPDAAIVEDAMEEIESMSREDYSNREIYDAVTSGEACASCHIRLNPLGFVLEGFGPMGEPRTQELVWDDAGEVLATHTVDTTVEDLYLGPEPAPASDANDLVASLAGSDQVRSCFANHWLMNARMRPSQGVDTCAIEDATERMREGATVLETLAATVANDDTFWRAID